MGCPAGWHGRRGESRPVPRTTGDRVTDRPLAIQPLATKLFVVEQFQDRQHLGRERLVQLDDLDFAELETGRIERPGDRQCRS